MKQPETRARGGRERERASSFQMSRKQERGAGKLAWARLCGCNLASLSRVNFEEQL